MFEISNGNLHAVFNPVGAELSGLKANGVEYLWTGDPRYWPRRAPLLFPIVGRLKEDSTIISGKEYSMGQHGFIRDLPFAIVSRRDDEIVFRTRYTAETLEKYPFRYRMDVTYRLEGKSLVGRAEILNEGSEIMPFNFGFHPGFNCPLYPKEGFADYSILFEKPESFSSPKVEKGLLKTNEASMVFTNLDRLDLRHGLFAGDAIIIFEIKSEWVALLNGSGKGIRLHFPGFKSLGIWSPPGKEAPFICLEPWIGYADAVDSDRVFIKKVDLVFLEPGKSFEAGFRIEILD
ncbi:MAG TPA: aldose 1-epimerase family protein [Acholeplasmataceae bacterium]|nr:aldose 1-epimerase family protein [Acholeplasmataceae bacterium]